MTSNEPPIETGQPTRTSIASAGNDRISSKAQQLERAARQRPEERAYSNQRFRAEDCESRERWEQQRVVKVLLLLAPVWLQLRPDPKLVRESPRETVVGDDLPHGSPCRSGSPSGCCMPPYGNNRDN